MLIAELNHISVDPAHTVGAVGVAALVCYGVWAFTRWVVNAPSRPDPWDDLTATEIAKDETPALCHRCLEPHDGQKDFCPHCGAPVGQYTNILPYVYLFSVGHALRIGTGGDFKRTPLTVAGFILFSFTEYSIFAPVYWGVLIWKLLDPPPEPGPIDSPENVP